MGDPKSVSRRQFIHTGASGVTALGMAATTMANTAGVATGANSRLNIGFIGPGGRGFNGHVKPLVKLRQDGQPLELVAVNDVYDRNAQKAIDYIKAETGHQPKRYENYRDLLADPTIDAVCIGTPDHWHARQTIDAMQAGKHVYCEKPMTHSIQEAFDVVDAWNETGKVMQVGVQSTALPIWDVANSHIREGKLGKVLMYQTEFFRNSSMGQWRYYELTPDMTPSSIDWKQWLGVEEGLAPEMPFDRAIFAQWRRFWPFGSGMYTDLFVHRTTSMLKATGLRLPERVVGAGGIYLEYDGRDVPDVATVVADYGEGVQGLITATMACANTPIRQLIRGHHGSFVFGNGEAFEGFDFVAERSQVTLDSSIQDQRFDVAKVKDSTYDHHQNFIRCCLDNTPHKVNCPPDLGAAAIVTVNLGSRSYREGKVFHFDPQSNAIMDGDSSWAARWEKMSENRDKPMHVAGWQASDLGSTLVEPKYQSLEGPWIDGKDPAGSS